MENPQSTPDTDKDTLIAQLRLELEKYRNLYLTETSVIAVLLHANRLTLAQVGAARELVTPGEQ